MKHRTLGLQSAAFALSPSQLSAKADLNKANNENNKNPHPTLILAHPFHPIRICPVELRLLSVHAVSPKFTLGDEMFVHSCPLYSI